MGGDDAALEPSGRVTCPRALLAQEGTWQAQQVARVARDRWREAWREAGRVEPPVGHGLVVLSTSEDEETRMVTVTARYRPYQEDQ